MILAPLCALVLGFAYSPPAKAVRYEVGIAYDGFLPVFGGQEGKFQASMEVDVEGAAADGEGVPRSVSEVKSLKVVFNGAELPFTVDSIKTYFPRTTITHTALGKILKTDAPDVSIPVKLPGLDVKRFPDISYMPIEFPEGALEVGKSWVFKKAFGGSDVEYTVTPTAVSATEITVGLKASQTYEVLEDDGKQVVTDEATAVAKVKTVLEAAGNATLDPGRGLLVKLSLNGKAVSTVTDLKTGALSKRELGSGLEIKLVK